MEVEAKESDDAKFLLQKFEHDHMSMSCAQARQCAHVC